MRDEVYTLGVWRVGEARQQEFITAWKELGMIFTSLPIPPSGRGTLIQSTTDPTLFYSFGPWRSLDDVATMRTNGRAQAGIRRLREICIDATPGTFRLIAESE
jgi:hypothetical protein